MKAVAAACKKPGIDSGARYSGSDREHPNPPVTSPRAKVKRNHYDLDACEKCPQGRSAERFTNHGPLLRMGNDMATHWCVQRGQYILDLVRQPQPNLLVNNRTGDGGDCRTPRHKIGAGMTDEPWEASRTVPGHNGWARGGAPDGIAAGVAPRFAEPAATATS